MPIDFFVDHEYRVVMARMHGTVTLDDIRIFGRRVGTRSGLSDYNSLIDLSDVEHLHQPSADQVRELANLLIRNDSQAASPSHLAILAPDDVMFGMAEMFESWCDAEERTAGRVRVFRIREHAAAFLHLPLAIFNEEPGRVV